jgi:hypothetical protein
MKRIIPLIVMGVLLSACHKDEDTARQIPAAQITGTPTSGGTSNPATNPTGTGTSGNTGTTTPPSGSSNPGTKPSTTTVSGLPSGSLPLQIYTDDLHQGGAFLYPGGENQVLSFNDQSNPAAGSNSMRYVWNGGDVAGQHVFAGVDLIHSGSLSDYNSTPGKDLRPGKYTRVTFDARGSLGPQVVVKIEVADDGNPSTPAPCVVLSASGDLDDSTPGNPAPSCMNKASLTDSWQSFSLPVSPANLSSVKDYFKATYIYKGPIQTPGTGGTLFVDQILYQS